VGGNDDHHLPDRGQAATSPTSRRRATAATSARERDTGERRAAGNGHHLPNCGYPITDTLQPEVVCCGYPPRLLTKTTLGRNSSSSRSNLFGVDVSL